MWAQSAPELAVAGLAGTALTAVAGTLLARRAFGRLDQPAR
jgi:hypothetical protein